MRSKRLPLLLGGASLLLSACAPDVYKDDIATFDESVVKSVDAFDALRLETDAGVIAGIENDLAKRGADVKPVGDCTDIVTGRLQKESSCMAKWASYRASGATASDLEPLCREPARDEASGELEFYDLSEVTALEAQECRLGVVEDPKQPPRADLLTAPGVLRNTAELGTRLKAYARALGDLANAEDTEALKSALGDAKTAIEGLAERAEAFAQEKVPGRTAIGPVAELASTALLETFKARRFTALKSIVNDADPVILQSAKILSRTSMPLMIPKLRRTGTHYLK